MHIAADSSTLVAFFNGEKAPDVDLLIKITQEKRLVIPPVVIAEILSSADHKKILPYIEAIPVLEITIGYWNRAAELRRILIKQKLKSRLADALISQSCLDANVPLITRDKDFRHYQPLGLQVFLFR